MLKSIRNILTEGYGTGWNYKEQEIAYHELAVIKPARQSNLPVEVYSALNEICPESGKEEETRHV